MPDLAPPVAAFVEALHAQGRPRVWSIVATIFGDVVLHRGGRISMRDLQRLIEAIGINEGALRTAISRLAAEGWLEGERVGRNSFYSLSAEAERQSIEAGRVIYRAPGNAAKNWCLALGPGPGPEGAAQLQKDVWAWSDQVGTADPDDGFLRIDGPVDHVPGWVEAALISEARAAQIAELSELSERAFEGLSGFDALVARIMLIHFWRRIALGLPAAALDLLPSDAGVQTCHAHVAARYRELFDAAEAALPELPSAPAPRRFQR